jgi:uncharacterized protein YdaU (DUF1376 family)
MNNIIKNRYVPPYFKLYTKPTWEGLRNVPTNTRGVYISLLLAFWNNNCEQIKDDEHTHKILEIPKRDYDKSRANLMKICLLENGYWSLPELTKNHSKVMTVRKTKQVSGQMGGIQKELNKQMLAYTDTDIN